VGWIWEEVESVDKQHGNFSHLLNIADQVELQSEG
jgi:hypothetical protein